ncbi:uncharacterized protein [Halyomorpha halys]|uniref:uncharacterized protein n=1 Tax=Halyomorpha halys TaxID=286706 RepID=UPI0006D4CE5F|nr:uncharacterized protein LOC106677277 [Halyomorpha halys]
MLRNFSYAGKNLLRRYPTMMSQVCSVQNTANDEPVKFTTSKASQWKASFTRSGEKEEDEAAWFQPYVVSLSVVIFMVYFCVLREENDIDEKLGTSLYDRIEGLEEAQLRILLRYNLENGKETADIKKRIRELEIIRGKVESE